MEIVSDVILSRVRGALMAQPLTATQIADAGWPERHDDPVAARSRRGHLATRSLITRGEVVPLGDGTFALISGSSQPPPLPAPVAAPPVDPGELTVDGAGRVVRVRREVIGHVNQPPPPPAPPQQPQLPWWAQPPPPQWPPPQQPGPWAPPPQPPQPAPQPAPPAQTGEQSRRRLADEARAYDEARLAPGIARVARLVGLATNDVEGVRHDGQVFGVVTLNGVKLTAQGIPPGLHEMLSIVVDCGRPMDLHPLGERMLRGVTPQQAAHALHLIERFWGRPPPAPDDSAFLMLDDGVAATAPELDASGATVRDGIERLNAQRAAAGLQPIGHAG